MHVHRTFVKTEEHICCSTKKSKASLDKKSKTLVVVGGRPGIINSEAPVVTHRSAILKDFCATSHALHIMTRPTLDSLTACS